MAGRRWSWTSSRSNSRATRRTDGFVLLHGWPGPDIIEGEVAPGLSRGPTMRQKRIGVWAGAILLGLALASLASAEPGSSPEPKADKARKDEATRLARKLDKALAQINALVKEAQALRDKAVAAEIAARAARDRSE